MRPNPQRVQIRLAPPVRQELQQLASRVHAPHAVVVRAKLILLSAAGWGAAEVARRVGVSDRTVRKWKRRFAGDPRAVSLSDAPRSGRPPTITVEQRCQLVQLACERPQAAKKPLPFRNVWTHRSLAEGFKLLTGVSISASEVGRILRFEELRPHRIRQWLKCSDPEFEHKARRVCRLYLRPPEDGVVLSIDEKPMQALSRIHPTRVDPRDASLRHEYEYKRNGTQCLLGAFDVGTGRVIARVVPKRSAQALVDFMEEVARRYPVGKVYVVWDNLNIHYDGKDERWTEFNRRHGHRFRFIYTPKHASWLNQIEIWFSILHRRVLRCGSFDSVREQAAEVRGFIRHWNHHEAHPFRWTWRTDKVQNSRRLAA
jgi:transposase